MVSAIGDEVDELFADVSVSDALTAVIAALEADFASHRQIDPSTVRTVLFVDQADDEKRRAICAATDARAGHRGAIFTSLFFSFPESDVAHECFSPFFRSRSTPPNLCFAS